MKYAEIFYFDNKLNEINVVFKDDLFKIEKKAIIAVKIYSNYKLVIFK